MPALRDLSDGNHIHLIAISGVLLLSDINRYDQFLVEWTSVLSGVMAHCVHCN